MGFEDQIARDHHPHGKSWSDRQCRRNLKLALDDGFARAPDRVLGAIADRFGDLVATILAGFETDIEDRGEPGGTEQLAPVIVHTVFETAVSGLICPGLAFEDDGATVGQDQPGPRQEHAPLTGFHTAIIFAEQPRALRDQ